jgi:hypothetical protein
MVTKRQIAAVCRAAANRIEKYGWTQGRIGNTTVGFCAIGAIWASAPTPSRSASACLAVRKHNYISNIPVWNDSKTQTKEGVISALRKTARALEHGMAI